MSDTKHEVCLSNNGVLISGTFVLFFIILIPELARNLAFSLAVVVLVLGFVVIRGFSRKVLVSDAFSGTKFWFVLFIFIEKYFLCVFLKKLKVKKEEKRR